MEKFDVYDYDRNKTSKVYERGTKLQDNETKLVVYLCIFNSKGEMLIQKRRTADHTWAGKWDVTVCGGAQTGETSRQAIQREVKEELGLEIDFSKERVYMTIDFEHGINDFYILKRDIDLSEVHFDDGEVEAVKWANEKEILKLMKKHEFVEFYPSFISYLFEVKNRRGTYYD